MTAPAFVNDGTRTLVSSAATITPALPASRVNGNLLIAVISTGNIDKVFTFPAGWTVIGQLASSGNCASAVAWRLVDGTETAPAITWTGNTSAQARIYQYSGVNSSAIGTSKSKVTNPSSVTVTDTGMVLARNASLAVVFVVGDAAGGATIGAATNYAKDQDFSATGTGGNDAEYSQSSHTTSGSTTDTFTATSSASRHWMIWQIEVASTSNDVDISASPALGFSMSASITKTSAMSAAPAVGFSMAAALTRLASLSASHSLGFSMSAAVIRVAVGKQPVIIIAS